MKNLHIITPVKDSIDSTILTIRALLASQIDVPYIYTVYNDFICAFFVPAYGVSVSIASSTAFNSSPRKIDTTAGVAHCRQGTSCHSRIRCSRSKRHCVGQEVVAEYFLIAFKSYCI